MWPDKRNKKVSDEFKFKILVLVIGTNSTVCFYMCKMDS